MNNKSASPSPSPGAASPEPPIHPVEWAVEHGRGTIDDVLQVMNRRIKRKRRITKLKVGLGLGAFVIAGMIWLNTATEREPVRFAGSIAQVVAPERRVLADGSIVELRQGAIVEADFSSRVRRVILKAGDAHFQVAQDPNLPFVVQAGALEVRAVGTAFSISLADKIVDVVVTEGRVALARQLAPTAERSAIETLSTGEAPAANGQDLLLSAGGRAVVDLSTVQANPPRVEHLPAPALAERMAWRVPRLEFSGTPLSEVVALFNAQSAGNQGITLSIADRSIDSVLLSGTLRINSVDTLLNLLQEGHGIRAERKGAQSLILHAPQ